MKGVRPVGIALAALLAGVAVGPARAAEPAGRASGSASGKGVVMAGDSATAGTAAADSSQVWAKRILALKVIDLPDEWQSARGASLTERFQATFKAMPPGPGKPASADALIARYANHGEPFVHSVWFNQPLRCSHCQDGGAEGFHVVVSVRNGATVTITALEMHEALEHQLPLPAAKVALLRQIFAPAGPRP